MIQKYLLTMTQSDEESVTDADLEEGYLDENNTLHDCHLIYTTNFRLT